MTETPETPEPLLPRVAAGDAAAVQECIDRYKKLIWWLARRHAGHDAEDAVQEIFIALWSSAERFDPSRSSEPTFVTMIARRRLIDRRRKVERRPIEEPLEADSRDIPVARSGAVEAAAEVALAERAFRQLKDSEREVLLLSVRQGMSHSEIAERTGLPLGTVKTYVRRGLIRVRELLDGGGRAREATL